MTLSELPVEKLTGEIDCPCGRTHRLETKLAAVVPDAPTRLVQKLADRGICGRILLLCDENTYPVLGERTESALAALAPVDVCMLRSDSLHADEAALGAALIGMREDTRRIVAVGSGTINDIARFIAARVRVPYDILGTAPSMDGFVSTVSPLIRRGFKVTYEAVAPEYSLLDLPAMLSAPQSMVAAGLGDILGKYTALADWAQAREIWEEYYCEETVSLMRRAVDTCRMADLAACSADGIRALGEGLLLSGLAMQMVGVSRPASGCEHHLAHTWEMLQMIRGERPTLHGDKVGYAELLALEYYQRFFQRKRPFADVDEAAWQAGIRRAFGPIAGEVIGAMRPDSYSPQELRERAVAKWDCLCAIADSITHLRGEIRSVLHMCGGPTTAKELGLSRDDVRSALLYAKEIRPRPTLMRLAFAWGVHQEICEEIVEGLDA